jgi:hypothetical protein
METEFQTRVRGWKHTVPKKEQDVKNLQIWYNSSKSHEFVAGRDIKSNSDSDRPKDTVTDGFIALQTSNALANWIEGRTIERATHQNWDSGDSDSN